MSKQPLVSVIVPFYNSEKFLDEAIDNVLLQTYENWELFLIDDGSIDSSTEIALKYASQYPSKIYYLEHENHNNRGACASRNLGIRHSKGKYIALLDSDDIWLKTKLEEQVKIIENSNDVSFTFGTSLYWHSWSKSTDDLIKDNINKLGLKSDTIYYPPDLLKLVYPLGKASAPCPSNLLIKREAIDKIGGFEESFKGIYQLYEDQAFLSKLYLNFKAYVKDKCWIKYRIHSDSCDSKVIQSGHHIKVRMYYLKWLKDYFYERNVEDKLIWEAFYKKYDEAQLSMFKESKVGKYNKNKIDLIKERKEYWKNIAVYRGNKIEFLEKKIKSYKTKGIDGSLLILNSYIEYIYRDCLKKYRSIVLLLTKLKYRVIKSISSVIKINYRIKSKKLSNDSKSK